MLLSDVESLVRQDLFDPAGASQRWSTADIDRAIDKAVERYSAYYPNIVYIDMQSEPYQRTYPYPLSWNPGYPVWWIERIIYPLQVYGSQFASPGLAATASATAGTGLGIGPYQYGLTFISQGGETTISPLAGVSTSTGNQRVSLSNLPIAPALPATPGIATNTVIGRNIYRSQVAGSTMFYLTTIADNSTTTYSDSVSDTSLSGQPNPPTINSSGVMYWPPRERNFSEYSDIWDSTAALAVGGNQGLMGAAGTALSPIPGISKSFTLMLNSAELPKDNTLILRIFYATKQQLDAAGSTIPEVHRDIIVLGAVAYALEAYQIPTNDNFEFQDGSLRDRIDDTKIPQSWLAAARNKMQQFLTRLEEIKRQRDYGASSRAHWGDIARYWPRL